MADGQGSVTSCLLSLLVTNVENWRSCGGCWWWLFLGKFACGLYFSASCAFSGSAVRLTCRGSGAGPPGQAPAPPLPASGLREPGEQADRVSPARPLLSCCDLVPPQALPLYPVLLPSSPRTCPVTAPPCEDDD